MSCPGDVDVSLALNFRYMDERTKNGLKDKGFIYIFL